MWSKSRIVDEYALTVNDDRQFVVEHTSRSNPFAAEKVERIQHACLGKDGDLRVISANSTPEDCHLFSVDDLPQEEREAIVDEGFTGTYDEVLGRLKDLADDALPGCVDKQKPEDNKCREVQ